MLGQCDYVTENEAEYAYNTTKNIEINIREVLI